ncbi:DUF4982 domain-containing protein [Microbacterium sp. kSW2-24]|uniref:glycoside hydrolase family 2 protein n=1 Tax=Microbacterium galbinum TaxID=2851646 RepID=UPI001FFCC794|nr:glycoside hydrolase family 2 TIM barrel-domain containing protein [Microbacterium galbinum]MCK2022682.1 DUF4982 domain-containing protein [Microbacterium galbinum]
MTRESFNTSWTYRVKATAFQELGGASADAWRDVTLPHDALLSCPRSADVAHGETTGYFPGGSFEYRRVLVVPVEDRGKYIALEFGGVYRDASVYVNGALAGQNAFGYSRFVVRIDPYVRFGAENEIRVECRAHLDSRWYTGAGIYRDVFKVVKNPLRIAVDSLRVSTPDVDAERAIVEIESLIENSDVATASPYLTAIVISPEGVEVARQRTPVTLLPGESARARFRLRVPTPMRWSVDTPDLYEARLELADGEQCVDAEATAFGIRTLQLDALHGLRINGEQVKLRGACIHADNGPLGAAAIARAEERKIQLLKAAGFNAIRSSHHPASPALLDACDRLGMLVMDETFDVWTSSKSDFDYSFNFPRWWEDDLQSLVAKDFNHPSVIFYSIGNEIPETGDRFGGRMSRQLAEKLRSLDRTRFITNGINGFVSVLDTVIESMRQRREAAAVGGGVNQMMGDFGQMMGQIQASPMVTARTEEAFAVLDVAGMNYGTSRYTQDVAEFPDRIIVGAETWPAQIDENWALVRQHANVIGDFTWTGLDYLGETGLGGVKYADESTSGSSFVTQFPGLTAWSGDLDITGHRRPVSYYREIVFGLRAEPYIAVQRPHRYGAPIAVSPPWAWSDTVSSWSWGGFEGQPVHVEVYADADHVQLELDGATIARAAVGTTRAYRAEFETIFEPGTLTAVAFRDGQEVGRSSLSSATGGLRLEVVADRQELVNGTGDLAFIEIRLVDDEGTVRNVDDRRVAVEVSGAGQLQGMGSGNPVTTDSFSAGDYTTFDGRALAVVRPTGRGDVTLRVTADGCDAVQLSLTVI